MRVNVYERFLPLTSRKRQTYNYPVLVYAGVMILPHGRTLVLEGSVVEMRIKAIEVSQA